MPPSFEASDGGDHAEEAAAIELALRYASRPDGLPYRVLHELLGQPRRYSELKPLLGELNDNNLTAALRQLADNGLVAQVVSYERDREAPVKSHRLTAFGVQTVLVMHSVKPQVQAWVGLQRYMLDQFNSFMEEMRTRWAGPAKANATQKATAATTRIPDVVHVTPIHVAPIGRKYGPKATGVVVGRVDPVSERKHVVIGTRAVVARAVVDPAVLDGAKGSTNGGFRGNRKKTQKVRARKGLTTKRK